MEQDFPLQPGAHETDGIIPNVEHIIHDVQQAGHDVADSLFGNTHHEDAGAPHDASPWEHSTGFDHDGVAHPDAVTETLWNDVRAVTNDVHTAVENVEQFLGISDGLDSLHHEYDTFNFPGFEQFNDAHGTPRHDMHLWEQQESDNSCAVATTNMLFRSFGVDIGEPQLAHIFESSGIYDPDTGTNVHEISEVINNIADSLDMNVHAAEIHFDVNDLKELLDDGVRPLIAVNASELYDSASAYLNSLGIIPDAGHAVQLTGIVESPEGEMAVLNDPGIANGAGYEVPMGVFMDAASHFDFDGVAMFQS